LDFYDELTRNLEDQLMAAAGNPSAWGLANAVTYTAEDAADDDGATELEAAGGRVIGLGPTDRRALAA
jgi:hypothetical protein